MLYLGEIPPCKMKKECNTASKPVETLLDDREDRGLEALSLER